MSPESFAYWLHGYFEIGGDDVQLSAQQVQIIKDHLALVFKKETPAYGVRTAITVGDGYEYDVDMVKSTNITTPLFCGDRIQDGWPNGILPQYTGIEEAQKDFRYKDWVGHSYKWDVDRKVWTVDINPNTPVEITKTSDYVNWSGPQATC